MYVPKAFAIDDLAALQDFMQRRSFATIVAAPHGKPLVGQAPMLIDRAKGDKGTLSFHVARFNPLVEALRTFPRCLVVFSGPDAYVSPDWYESHDMVPTWNYATLEVQGRSRMLSDEEKRAQVIALSAEHEARLAPKKPWLVDKMTPGRFDKMLEGIVAFEIAIEALDGKWKMSQNRNAADRAGVVKGLEARGDMLSTAVAGVMRALDGARED